MSKWKEYKLGDIADKITKGTTPSTLGGSFLDKGINFIKAEAVTKEGTIDESTFAYIDLVTHEKLKRSQLQEGDILFSMAGVVLGKTAIVEKRHLPANTNQALALIRINPEKALPKYVKYFLGQKRVFDYVNSSTAQSAQPNINLAEIGDLKITLPPLPTQTAIASILSSLDDKIDLNNKINKNLEDLAQALFKQWFVDFEFPFDLAQGMPNENGDFSPLLGEMSGGQRGYKSSGGEMAESELGEIPKGWKIGVLGELCNISKINVKPFENPTVAYYHYSLPSFDEGKLANIEYGDTIKSSKFKVLHKSVLVSKLNPRFPRVWYIGECKETAICSTEFQVIKPKKDIFFEFVYSYCNSQLFTESLTSRASGTSGSHQRVKPDDMINIEIPLPNDEIFTSYKKAVSEFFQLSEQNRLEIRNLKNLRDTLLPKLISGELEVNEALPQTEIAK